MPSTLSKDKTRATSARSPKSWPGSHSRPVERIRGLIPVLMKLTETNRWPIWFSTHMIFGIERRGAFVFSRRNIIPSEYA